MINKLIIDTLKSLKVPVAFQKYNGKATFHKYLATGEKHEDDDDTDSLYVAVQLI